MPETDKLPNRQSVRLKNYDYSQPGVYFVTICAADRRCIFGDIRDGVIVPSAWGQSAERWWREIPRRWPPVELNQYVLIPNRRRSAEFVRF